MGPPRTGASTRCSAYEKEQPIVYPFPTRHIFSDVSRPPQILKGDALGDPLFGHDGRQMKRSHQSPQVALQGQTGSPDTQSWGGRVVLLIVREMQRRERGLRATKGPVDCQVARASSPGHLEGRVGRWVGSSTGYSMGLEATWRGSWDRIAGVARLSCSGLRSLCARQPLLGGSHQPGDV